MPPAPRPASTRFFRAHLNSVFILLAGVGIGWLLRSRRSSSLSRAAQTDTETGRATGTGQPPDFLREALQWCLPMSGARRVLLWHIDDSAALIKPIACVGGPSPSPHVVHGNPIAWIARERISAHIDPPPVWAVTRRVIGVPVTESRPRHALTLELADDITVMPGQFDALGIYVGAVLNVVHDHDVLTAHQLRSEHLIDALRILPTVSTVDALGRELAHAATRIAGAGGAALSAWNGDEGAVLFAESGVRAGASFTATESLSSLAARGAGTIVREGSTLREMCIVAKGERYPFTPEAAAAIPLMLHGRVTGILTIWGPRPIPEIAITTLETIAPYAAAQLEHAHELSMMRELAERDPLTGLFNRRAFDHHLEAEAARFERYRRPFALIVMDLDHFKSVNDRFGHDAGDVVLKKFAEIIRASSRDVDAAARLGGEEFALLLPETDKSHALEIAERIRKRLEATVLEYQGTAFDVRCSAGVAAVPEHGVHAHNVFQIADQLLYDAKRRGRNQVVTLGTL